MQFVFIDEIECNQKDPNFYGIGAVVFNYSTYHMFKEAYSRYFKDLGWNPSIEFKGKFLFSSAGDPSVPIEKRIEFVTNIVRETSSEKNSRIKFIFCANSLGDCQENHLSLLKNLIPTIKPLGVRHKKIIAFFLDRNDKITKAIISDLINNCCQGLVFERPFFVDSDNQLPGIITIDILNYLQSWVELNPQGKQLDLFKSTNDKNKIKLDKVNEILSLLKNVKRIKYKNNKEDK